MQTAESTDSRTGSPFISGYARWILLLILILLASYNLLRLLPGTIALGARGAADFSIFYTGALIVKHGLGSHLYDLSVQAQYHSPFFRTKPLPYNHLAYELLIFLPFASVPYTLAFWLWNAVNVLLIAASSIIVSPYLRNLLRPPAVVAFLATVAFFPVMVAFSHAQDSILLLLIFSGTFALLKLEKDFLAGLVLALGLFKFPLVLPFAVPFLLRKQWDFVRGFAAGALLVIAVSVAITGVNGTIEFGRLMNLLARHPEIGYIAPARMPDARGFFTAILPGWPIVQVALTAIATLLLLALSTFKLPRGRDVDFDAWFALTLFVTTMASPHLYRHDLTPLVLALLLAWNVMLGRNPGRTALLTFGAVTVVLFATPIYEVVNELGVTSYLFIILLLGAVSIARLRHYQEWSAKT